MNANCSGRCNLGAVLGSLDECHSALVVNIALGVHAAEDACAANCHVSVSMCNEDGGADGVVAAACGVGAVDSYENRDTHLSELSVAVEGGAAAATVGVYLLLLVELNAGAVKNIDERDAEHLSGVGSAENVLCLSGDPSACKLLVVGSNDYSPLAVDTAEALNDSGGAFLVVAGVVKGVEGAPGTLIDKAVYTLHSGHLALSVKALGGLLTSFENCFYLFSKFSFSCLELSNVLFVYVEKSLADYGHVLKIAGHRIVVHIYFISLS